jgi:hypothetical protein
MPKPEFEPPGRPRLTVNIGVTGHRSLPDANLYLLQEQLSRIFDAVDHVCQKIFADSGILYDPRPPLIRLLSPLAEGSDRIAAKCALVKGCELQCPLPFGREEYMKDFVTEASKAEFTDLLDKAASVFEVDCDKGPGKRNYKHVGEIVVGHSDVLIAIWTGEYSEKIGGTGDIVNKAMEQHVPVLWVNSKQDHAITFVHEGLYHEDWQHQLSEVMTQTFGSSSESGTFARLYLEEKRKKWNIAFFHTVFQDMMTGQFLKRVSLHADKHLQHAQDGWNRQWKKGADMPEDFKGFAGQWYRPYYIWTECLSSFYADYFRTAGLFRHLFYFLATAAYGFGLYFGFWYKGNGDQDPFTLVMRGIGFAFQAIFLLSIIWVRKRNDDNQWHQKFIDYRILAELLRQTLFLTPLGTGLHGVNMPAYNRDANTNWINWYYRVILRQGGLPHMLLDREQLQKCRHMVVDILKDQIAYHRSNARKNRTIARKLEKFGDAVYWVSLFFFFMHAGYIHWGFIQNIFAHIFFIHAGNPDDPFHNPEKMLNYLCLVLPALAAVAHAFAEQGGFQRLEQRSDAMARDLALAKRRFEEIPADGSYSRVKAAAENIAYLMISEVSDWRVFVKSKEIRNH